VASFQKGKSRSAAGNLPPCAHGGHGARALDSRFGGSWCPPVTGQVERLKTGSAARPVPAATVQPVRGWRSDRARGLQGGRSRNPESACRRLRPARRASGWLQAASRRRSAHGHLRAAPGVPVPEKAPENHSSSGPGRDKRAGRGLPGYQGAGAHASPYRTVCRVQLAVAAHWKALAEDPPGLGSSLWLKATLPAP
jgi:hypothetical protein